MPKDGNRQIELPKLFTIEQVATFTQFSTRQIAENDLALFLATFKHQ
jgi:hypothetical protein